jgi:hypothetical protein
MFIQENRATEYKSMDVEELVEALGTKVTE